MCVGGEGCSEQLVNSSAVCGVKSLRWSGAVNLRAGTPGPHPGRSRWVVALRGVPASRVQWGPPGTCRRGAGAQHDRLRAWKAWG